ncbi:MAG: hypothetical protein J0I17_10695 ['Candidatus Kapabacteria' thiocyanatum]|uniref:Lipoprotein n=1 Tax=Candidatus Kapaibacterium thiocyanatum TaxID=1895771 RepID=A0A1M3L3L6_9BACT|nr:hypothetical protein ['Candidatus Kapabacteria' thiocyanatum]OJX59954.1 MAG: hypothetical protein BGO89_08140 ['Candidatus Kapabacteria' thiocyanatum]
MKLFAIIVVVSTVLLSACSKDGGAVNPDPTPALTTTLSATINGTDWVGTNVVSIAAGGIRQITGGSANLSSGYQISVQMRNIGEGTYNVSTASNWFSVVRYENGGESTDPQFATSGTVTITKSTSEVIIGKFEGTAGSYVVTKGAFTIKL